MDTNIAAWMIAGGPRIEDPHAARDRGQLHAFLESQRLARPAHVGLIERIRAFATPKAPEKQLDCCPA